MRMLGTRKRLGAVAAVSLVAVAAGSAWAAIPDSSGQVTLCYQAREAARRGGADLRVIDPATGRCLRSDTQLSINQRGPAGPQGPAGTATAGGAGAAVLVARLADGDNGASVDVSASPTGAGEVVLERPAPAGSYTIDALVDANAAGISCSLLAGADVLDTATVSLPGRVQVGLLGAVTLAEQGTLQVRCTRADDLDPSLVVLDARLVATPAASVSATTYTPSVGF